MLRRERANRPTRMRWGRRSEVYRNRSLPASHIDRGETRKHCFRGEVDRRIFGLREDRRTLVEHREDASGVGVGLALIGAGFLPAT